MSARRRASAAWGVIWTLLLLPARIVEESSHALAALPFAERVLVSLTPGDGGVETAVRYRDSTPRWAIRLAHVAPEIVAWVAAVATIAWWTLGGAVWWPDSGLDWVLLWWVGVQYLAIGLPEQGGVPADRGQVMDDSAMVSAAVIAIAVTVVYLVAEQMLSVAGRYGTGATVELSPGLSLTSPHWSSTLPTIACALLLLFGVWMHWGVWRDAS